MKFGYLATMSYEGRIAHRAWPQPNDAYDPELGRQAYEHGLAQAKHADDVGFDMVSVSEHHYTPGLMTPNPMVAAAALTQVVKRAEIFILGPVMPLNNPVRIAEELAMVDTLSGGRTRIFFVRGTPNEWFTYPTEVSETKGRTQEAALLVRDALTRKEPFSHEGEYYTFPRVSVWPGTVRQPHPPMYFSGNSPDSLEFAAEHRFGIALGFGANADLLVPRYRELCAASGWEPTPDHVLMRTFTSIADTDEEARERLAGLLRGFGLGRNADPEVQRAAAQHRSVAQIENAEHAPPHMDLSQSTICGSPDTVIEVICQKNAAGVGTLDMAFATGAQRHDTIIQSLDRFAEEVLPKVQDLPPAW
jgi:alkanesulfonate monooxygenase SsuD/methylene tetrahydromethanopterin reductase-like flavin-dependent oxidoreductase (luciferase family)